MIVLLPTYQILMEAAAVPAPMKMPRRSQTCDNCGAVVPACGRCSDGRFVCCEHCVFNPTGCRCSVGEFGVPNGDIGFYEICHYFDDTGEEI